MTTELELFYAGGRIVDDATIVVMNETHRDALEAAMAMDDSLSGYLVPPEYTVEIAVRLGMPRLPDMTKWDDRVHAKIGRRPLWWQWLFHNYSTNKIASFLVWRWPKFPDVVNAYDNCGRAHREEKECRVQKAHEFLQGVTQGVRE